MKRTSIKLSRKMAGTGAACVFLLVSGIFYSCTFLKKDPEAVWMTDLAEPPEEADLMGKASTGGTAVSGSGKATGDSSVTGGGNASGDAGISGSGKASGDTEASDSGKASEDTGAVGNGAPAQNEYITAAAGEPEDVIYIHICGAVVNPGIYETKAGARVFDLIELAGGLGPEAAGDAVNQAQPVNDGERIYIPTREEVKDDPVPAFVTSGTDPNSGTAEGPVSGTQKVNINTADAKLLMELPGVGEAKAESIIRYREENGKFQEIRDIMKISGIKEGLFNKIADYITTD